MDGSKWKHISVLQFYWLLFNTNDFFCCISSDGLRDRIKKRIAELRNSRGGTAKEGGGRTKKGGKKVTEGMTVVSLKHGNSKVYGFIN